jgi:hypothetical protein
MFGMRLLANVRYCTVLQPSGVVTGDIGSELSSITLCKLMHCACDSWCTPTATASATALSVPVAKGTRLASSSISKVLTAERICDEKIEMILAVATAPGAAKAVRVANQPA